MSYLAPVLSLFLWVKAQCSVAGQHVNGQGVSVRSVGACRPRPGFASLDRDRDRLCR
jgi:hypothetical protein